VTGVQTCALPISAKFLTFEVEAIAKSYVMENIESQLAEIRGDDDEDED
jgi:hypothetical protein